VKQLQSKIQDKLCYCHRSKLGFRSKGSCQRCLRSTGRWRSSRQVRHWG